MKHLSSTLFISLLLALLPKLHAADGDWQLWTEASWTQVVASSLDLSLRAQGRVEKDISDPIYDEIEPMLVWRYSPRWTFAMAYEQDQRFGEEDETTHKPSFSATMDIPIKDWSLSNRFRMEFPVPQDESETWQAVYSNQTSFGTSWKIGSIQIDPFVSEKWLYSIQEGRFMENQLAVGVGVPIVRHWEAQVYWMRLDERGETDWEWHPVLGMQIAAQF